MRKIVIFMLVALGLLLPIPALADIFDVPRVSPGSWGSIAGTITNQTDLQATLAAERFTAGLTLQTCAPADTTPTVQVLSGTSPSGWTTHQLWLGRTGLTYTDFTDYDGDTGGAHADLTDGDWFVLLGVSGGPTIDFSANANIKGNASVDYTMGAGEVALFVWSATDSAWVCTNLVAGMSNHDTMAVSSVDLALETDYKVAGVAYSGTSKTFTNTTLDVDGATNAIKTWGRDLLTHPSVFAAGVTQQTTVTSRLYGQALFADDADVATNYIEYLWRVPDDIDTSVDLVGTFTFILGGADTADHDYLVSLVDVAASAAYDTAADLHPYNLAYTADANGADKDVEYAGPTTLTDWKGHVTAGQLCLVRVARDGDDGANDASIVDSYSMSLLIKYKRTQ